MSLFRHTAVSSLRLPHISLAAARLSITTNAGNGSRSKGVDPTEVSHFNQLASSWWDPHGPSRLLHLMNPSRHSFLQRCLSSEATAPVQRKLHLLDIGCGGGIFSESAARLPNVASVTAIDPSPEVIRVAEEHKRRDPLLMQQGRLNYLNVSIDGLPQDRQPPEGYDVVTLFEVLEHVPHPSSFLTSVLPRVKPGGWIVLSTISRTWTSWFVTKLVAEDVLGIVPRGTHEWSRYINEKELRTWFAKREGWGSPRAVGVMYVPGIGWREIPGGEGIGNYFFGIRKSPH